MTGRTRPVDPPVVLATTATVAGGLWRHMRDLAEGLRDRGREVRFALPPTAVVPAQEARATGFPVMRLGESVPGAVWHLHLGDTYDRQALGHLIRARRTQAAVVLTDHLPRTDASDAALAVRPPRRGAWAAKTSLKKAQLALVDRMIAVSRGSRDFMLTRYGVSPTRVRVVENGLPAGKLPIHSDNLRQQSGPKAESLRAVAVGSIIRQKGIDVLVDAVGMSGERWVADVFGDGPHREAMAARAAADPRTAPRLRFRGWTNNSSGEFASADLAVIPSRWEACPYAALEAMDAGLPVIATRVDGLSDIVVPNHTGLLVPPEQPSALAEALDSLTRRPDLAKTMGANGRIRVRQHYSLPRMVDGTAQVYEEALGRRNHVRAR